MRRLLSLLLALSMLTTFALAAVTTEETAAAGQLYELGLFKGVGADGDGDPVFDLDRAPSRVEAVTMLVRALGAGEAAGAMEKSHPFTDVPAWADGYVSYAYEEGLTKGVSETAFGSDTTATCGMYLTFMLRALGYAEGSGEDFTYDQPYDLAEQAGLLPEGVDPESFTRGDVAEVTAAALLAERKGEETTLAGSLIAAGAFTAEAFAEAFPEPPTYEEALAGVLNADAFHVHEQIETPACTIVLGYLSGVPHSPYSSIDLVYKAGSARGEGVTVSLPTVAFNGWGSSDLPDAWELSDDQSSFIYTYHFDEPLMTDGRVWHEAGTYRFTVDLITGEVEEVLEPLSLDETLAWFAGHGYTVEQTLDAPACTVVLCRRTFESRDAAGNVVREGVDYELYLIYKAGGQMPEGAKRELPLPLTVTSTAAGATYADTDRGPDTMELSEDGRTLTYAYRFETALTDAWGSLEHTAGIYRYTVDLASGEVVQTIDPL